jgi:phenylacetate-coenzyme A ligase PaaK-like adenylate-forming protein
MLIIRASNVFPSQVESVLLNFAETRALLPDGVDA